MPLEKHACLIAIVNAAQESIASPESKLSTHAAALICPNLKDGIEASNAQCLELLKNATIEKDEEDVSSILFYSIFD